MTSAAQVYNRSPTSANVFGSGKATFTTLGLPNGLERLASFGSLCAVAQPSPEKGKLVNWAGRVLGVPSNTPGYIVLLDPPGGASSVGHEVIMRRGRLAR